ncbi:MAG: 2,3-bisphosphoglycerate-independent phosphoglycerate mutase [Pseudomonadota bacterium]
MSDAPKPVVLCILDGWGLRAETEGNAVALAQTPNYDRLVAEAPMATLKCSGEDVGLPEGQMGNSEVGHMNLGAGRVVWMDLPKIDNAIADQSLAARPALTAHIERLKTSGGACHLMGLLSPGGVHSHQRHIAELARIVSTAGVPVRLHLFLDGRDTPPKSALGFLSEFEASIDGLRDTAIATISGRFYALDRDNRWERVRMAYQAVAKAVGGWASTPAQAIELAYETGETDEFVTPVAIDGYDGMKDGDGVLFANFRADRAREILSALGDPRFDGFERDPIAFSDMCGMVEYSDRHNAFMSAIFPQDTIEDTLGAWVSAQGKTQFRLAETEKYPHVTFFFNGGVEAPNPGEERHMPPSPKVKTYDLQPEMSAPEVTTSLTNAIRYGAYDLIIVNYANPDMVGHTGDIPAAVKAVEAVDQGLGAAIGAIESVGGAMLVTADHGNCEMMIDPTTGAPHTAHTTGEVPIFLVNRPETLRQGGRLADVAPTLLALMKLPQPSAMSGVSLLEAP